MKKSIKKQPEQRLIPTAEFTAENSKLYILVTIILFHVLPFILALIGDTGKMILTHLFMFYMNPLIVFGTLFVYGLRVGFNAKMPLVVTLLAAMSLIMYYSIEPDLAHYVLTFLLGICVFAVMGFLGAVAGAFVKHLKVF